MSPRTARCWVTMAPDPDNNVEHSDAWLAGYVLEGLWRISKASSGYLGDRPSTPYVFRTAFWLPRGVWAWCSPDDNSMEFTTGSPTAEDLAHALRDIVDVFAAHPSGWLGGAVERAKALLDSWDQLGEGAEPGPPEDPAT